MSGDSLQAEDTAATAKWRVSLKQSQGSPRRQALWTDSNNKQDVVWVYGAQSVGTPINQEDIATAAAAF